MLLVYDYETNQWYAPCADGTLEPYQKRTSAEVPARIAEDSGLALELQEVVT